MKSKMTITVDSNVKEEFQRLAKRMGSSTSTLINMYFISAINTGNVRYYDESYSRVGEALYQEYVNADDTMKADVASIRLDTNTSSQLKEQLWN
ncbi:ribbon-helix-helix protein, CopG family [Candidatus Gracilibacteria bacterium]|nr:ribbon-helix-helix protein, CopG family [Candidatus Gracilibacteria bacterium]